MRLPRNHSRKEEGVLWQVSIVSDCLDGTRPLNRNLGFCMGGKSKIDVSQSKVKKFAPRSTSSYRLPIIFALILNQQARRWGQDPHVRNYADLPRRRDLIEVHMEQWESDDINVVPWNHSRFKMDFF